MATRLRARTILAWVGCCLGVAGTHAACGSESDSEFPDGKGPVSDAGSDGPGSFGDGGGGNGDGGPGCVNLQCKQVTCPSGGTTRITGSVYDPAGLNPLYNALVYIPNAPLAPFDDDAGATCDRCNGA